MSGYLVSNVVVVVGNNSVVDLSSEEGSPRVAAAAGYICPPTYR